VSWREWFRRPRLVPIAEFADRATAEEAWGALEEAGIPASVEGDPGALGGPILTRILVEQPDVERAQRLIAGFVEPPED
jgi:hypothetical protein